MLIGCEIKFVPNHSFSHNIVVYMTLLICLYFTDNPVNLFINVMSTFIHNKSVILISVGLFLFTSVRKLHQRSAPLSLDYWRSSENFGEMGEFFLRWNSCCGKKFNMTYDKFDSIKSKINDPKVRKTTIMIPYKTITIEFSKDESVLINQAYFRTKPRHLCVNSLFVHVPCHFMLMKTSYE